ncbi:MAG: MazG family protein, partial [Anaerolineales bacterium]|nr:MazG family protein [Anaerolineales bacterium]
AKIIRRHPHVFGDVKVRGAEDVVRNWEQLKAEERQHKPKKDTGVLGDVPRGLPALAQAEVYQKRAAKVGFDWPDVSGVIAKIEEEIAEIKAAEGPEAAAAEVGDLLFAVVNWARWLEIDPEAALRVGNARFAARFAWVEAAAKEQGRDLKQLSLAELDTLWEAAKATLAGEP